MSLKLQTAYSFLVVDSLCEGKYGPELPDRNDDQLYLGDHYIAAFDGVTGPQGRDASGLGVEILKAQHKDADERTFAKAYAEAAALRYGMPGFDTRMAATTAIILSRSKAELWCYGDSWAAMIGDDFLDIVTCEEGFAWAEDGYRVRKHTNEMWRRGKGYADFGFLYDEDPGRDMLGLAGKLQHHFANEDGGYSVLCAKPVPDKMAKKVQLRPGTKRVLMGTDGYPIRLFGKEAFESISNMELALQVINENDPHCLGLNAGPKGILRNPETGKLNISYDDRTLIDVTVQEF